MERVTWLISSVSAILIELFILLFADFLLRLQPDCIDRVDAFPIKIKRKGNEAGILLDDILDGGLRGKLL